MKVPKRVTLVALAVIAVVFSIGQASASAATLGFSSPGGTHSYAVIGGTQVGESYLQFGGMAAAKCTGQTVSGEIANRSQAASVDTWVDQAQCPNLERTFKVNPCDLTFNPNAKAVVLGPVGCGPAVLKSGGCEYRVPAQSFPATYTNIGSGSTARVRVQVSTSSMKWSSCTEKERSDGIFNITWELANYSDMSHTTEIGLSVSTQIPTGLSFDGSKFAADDYPATISGTQTLPELKLTTTGGNVKCKSLNLSGSIAAAVSDLSLSPSYASCTAFGQTATVSSTGCQYVFHASSLDLSCGAGSLKITVPGLNCSITVASQSVGGLSLTNVGSGVSRHIVASISGTPLSYTVSGPGTGCGTVGAHADGKVTGGFELSASTEI